MSEATFEERYPKKCPECNGYKKKIMVITKHGKVSSKEIQCPACKGRGRVA